MTRWYNVLDICWHPCNNNTTYNRYRSHL